MRMTEQRKKLLRKLFMADIPAEAVSNKKNALDLEWLQKNGLAKFTHLDDDDEIKFWAITESGEAELYRR
jgi:hypothetical protein